MNAPRIDDILAPLQPFQRRTVDHAFERLFLAPDSTARFLVADEVGLGKTLVARGVIARAIEHLWESVGRIDIVYICSNSSIARANLPKLQVHAGGERSFALDTRLTMLATALAPRKNRPGLANSKLNFVSFTPGTSFDIRRSTGRGEEREVLFQLLAPMVSPRSGLLNLLRGFVRPENWRRRLEDNPRPLDPSIKTRFEQAFRERSALADELQDLVEGAFAEDLEEWPEEARNRQKAVVGELRQLLARVCVDALEPDLVIMDEFQRFKSLLEDDEEQSDPAAGLAQALFGAETPEGNPVRTLLLSATPYKLYTADAEIEQEDHYEDFLATTRFLLGGDEGRVDSLRQALSSFGSALKRAAAGGSCQVSEEKSRVERMLGSVMARTERVSASDERDAMVVERRIEARLTAPDVQQYLAADALFRAVGDRDPMPFWKSAPYLAHFMHGYKLNQRLDETLELSPEKLATVLRRHAPSFLRASTLERWSKLDAGNAKLRELSSDLLDRGLWRLLWMPPTLPYWPLEGAYQGTEGATKSLLFSAWNVVPDVVSAMLSYEADRRMADGRMASYKNRAKQQAPLLRLNRSESGARSRHRLLLLLLPCLPLADEAHPLRAPKMDDRRQWVAQRVDALLSHLPDPQEGAVDERWEWAAPLLLDPGLRDFLWAWRDDEDLPRPNEELFGQYVDDFLELDPSTLGRRPPGLAALLVEVALGAPAIVAARSIMPAGIPDKERRGHAVRVAEAFWRLFNRPTVITLLNQLAEADSVSREESAYWRLVLRYCQHGNLQAVLDEQWHLLWEQQSWSSNVARSEMAQTCTDQLVAVVKPSISRVHMRLLNPSDDDTAVSEDELRVQTDFALRFGSIRTEEGLRTADSVRDAFNSPFRPFVLASTSIGQEGLDFHPWCHSLVHWNLPGNPVDLEQREGRVHRYKGHAVRRNVASAHSAEALAAWKPGTELWRALFAQASERARAEGKSDLVPCWMAPGAFRVERKVPTLPYTQEAEALARLKRQLAAYRVVFGQPRQEELVTLLDQADLDAEHLQQWAIDLSPPFREYPPPRISLTDTPGPLEASTDPGRAQNASNTAHPRGRPSTGASSDTDSAAAASAAPPKLTPAKQLQVDFWTHFNEFLAKRDSPLAPRKASARHWVSYTLKRRGFHLFALLNKRDGSVDVEVEVDRREQPEGFQNLLSRRAGIEAELGFELHWEAKGDDRVDSIYVRMDVDVEDRERWSEICAWMVPKLEAMRVVFMHHVKYISA